MARILAMAAALAVPAGVHAQTGTGEEPGTSGYPGNLPFYYDLYTFRGEDGGTDVVAAFAVRAGHLERERAGKAVRYRFDVTLVVADTARRTVTRTDDSVFVRLRRGLADEHLIYTQIQVTARPSPHTVQRVVMTEAVVPGVGQLYHSPFPVPDYGGAGLMLSDIALGKPTESAAGWSRGGVTLALLPTTQFPSSSFDVYYEVYNLPFGHRYTTEIRVLPLEGGRIEAGRDGPVGLRFSGRADSDGEDVLRELRSVEAALDPGVYLLTVVVTDEDTGASAYRSRRFHVRGWDRGTMLVGAHPRGRG